jgi:Tfp pilus assembly protein PilX
MQMVNNQQRGFVIPLGLFLLLGLSITAFAVANTGFFQEKMAGISVAMQRDFMAAETSIKQQEDVLAALTDMTGQTMIDSECGISEQTATSGGVTIRTTYYNPPPNGVNWGSGDGSKVLICHKYDNELIININAVGEDGTKHSGHDGDYLGQCINGSLHTPGDAWVTCTEKFGIVAKRLSWQQLWDI